jgi:hypothetical protein
MEFNSKEYTFCNLEVIAFGRPIITLQGLEYKSKKEKKVLKAAGGRNKAIQHGTRDYEGTLTILQSDMIALDREAKSKGYKDILDVDFDIVVSYIPDNSPALSVDKVIAASIS